MAYTKIALLAAFSAFAFAQTQEEIDELNVVLNDVKSNLQEYISLASDPSSGFSLSSLPSGVLDIGMAIASATDDSYTTLYSEVDFAAVSKMLTMVPWYSSRLEPALESLLGTSATSAAATTTSAAATTTSAAATTTSAAATTSSADSTTSSAAATTSSADATTSSADATTSSAAAATSSAAATTSSAAATTSSAAATTSSAAASTVVSSAKTSGSVSAISQITDGQVQATSTVAEQTENGAAKVAVGMGAGIMAAAAMLL